MKNRRFLRRCAVMLLTLCLLLSASGYCRPLRAEAPAADPAETEPAEEAGYPDAFIIFVSGIDSRQGLVDRSNSDVNILFAVNRDTRQVAVVTTPRDSYVPLSISDGLKDKLTHSGQYGIDVQVDSMELLYDIDIDYWFRVDFGGFANIIDALGGVTVDSDYTFTAWDGHSFVKGENELDGAAALAFARERKSFPDGDFQRGRDQMKLIGAMIKKILSPTLLTNYDQILEALKGSFETSIPMGLLAEMVAAQLLDNAAWNVVNYEVLGYGDNQVTYSLPSYGKLSVVSLYEDSMNTAKTLMADVLEGKTIEQPES